MSTDINLKLDDLCLAGAPPLPWVSFPSPPLTLTPCTFTAHNGGRYACLAVGQLAVVAVNHEEIISAGGLEGLKSVLDCDDGETVFNACYALNKLAMSDENHEVSLKLFTTGAHHAADTHVDDHRDDMGDDFL